MNINILHDQILLFNETNEYHCFFQIYNSALNCIIAIYKKNNSSKENPFWYRDIDPILIFDLDEIQEKFDDNFNLIEYFEKRIKLLAFE